jgi:hypothetical protein
MEPTNYSGNSHLALLGTAALVQIWHDAEADLLYVRWHGPYEPATAQAGWAQGCLRRQPCARVLNDTQRATVWPGREQWVGQALFLTLAAGGGQYMACVYLETLPGHVSLDLRAPRIGDLLFVPKASD